MSKVYIVQRQDGFDYSKAEKFGNIEQVLPAKLMAHEDPSYLLQAARERLAGYSNEDYLVPSGDPALIALCGSIIGKKSDKLNILKWDGRLGEYRELSFSI